MYRYVVRFNKNQIEYYKVVGVRSSFYILDPDSRGIMYAPNDNAGEALAAARKSECAETLKDAVSMLNDDMGQRIADFKFKANTMIKMVNELTSIKTNLDNLINF